MWSVMTAWPDPTSSSRPARPPAASPHLPEHPRRNGVRRHRDIQRQRRRYGRRGDRGRAGGDHPRRRPRQSTSPIPTTPSPRPGSGSLLVTKTIAGPLAGNQGRSPSMSSATARHCRRTFIPAAEPGGQLSQSFDDIPPGSVCTVTETADGATATVTATVDGTVRADRPGGAVVPVNVTDVYLQRAPESNPGRGPASAGSLRVTKTIAGPAAGQQGPVAMIVACGGPTHTFAFLIPAHTGPGSVSRFSRAPGRVSLHRHRDRRRPHGHGPGPRSRQAQDGDDSGRSHGHGSSHGHFLRRQRGVLHRLT